ncbi:Murein DD-endopeptidase MepM and murein hydrolase activator NlpD, contain LysM domain [Paenibacillus uliginis N3/975]|uniref:Murein DD-endopeptidase MepM and murein hydrolase activator NlpD, contain LysM domain n=1 Tax=Paenibacillus uliginis N3/975 TaxID=1313296 RepID=A0A1X7HVQ4_9BACL|nr:M23 family metallopeptidase [Paenibacillus uliginis]SMF92859.1 Murein DD-endopeptidase MepM and murein hydrolase activator NlpD, contain LysM domain [Paenibacillus uliginis N3/975]
MKGFKNTRWYNSIKQSLNAGRSAKDNENSRHESDVQADTKQKGWISSRKWVLIPAGAVLVAGSVFFAGREYVNANTLPFYHVYVNGQNIGTIEDDEQLDKLFETKQKYYQEKYPDTMMVLHTDGITTKADRDYKPVVKSEETLAKLDGMLKAYARGVELKVNGETVAIVKDQKAAQAAVQAAKEKYAPAEAAVKTGKPVIKQTSASAGKKSSTESDSVKSVEIKEDITVSYTKTDPNKVLDVEGAAEALTSTKEEPVIYTVIEGDTISSIAQSHNMKRAEVMALNPGLEEKYLQIGSELELSRPVAPLTVRTVETVTEKMASKPETIVRKSDELPLGKRKVVRSGRDGVKTVDYVVTKENGEIVSKQWTGQQVVQPALPEVVYKGTKAPEKKKVVTPATPSATVSESSGRMFAWPVSGARITSSYGQRWGRTHEGTDMVGGRTIMAAAGGTVVFAGYQGSYGNAVIVDHGNGYQTLYGHMSSISVRNGQSVGQGSTLGIMGSTGRSTGVHLHFEIRKNGVQQNPMKYL